jgi:hypothetical protein
MNFQFSTSSKPALGPTESPIQWVSRALSLEVNSRGVKLTTDLPTSAEVKKMWIYISTTFYAFVA